MSKQTNSNLAVFRFATIICLICSLVVSVAAVSLRGFQEKNALNEKRINILIAAGLAQPGARLKSQEIEALFKQITPVVVDLKTGKLVTDKNSAIYDMYKAAESQTDGHALSKDPANIKRIAKDGSAYLLIKDGEIKRVILPVQGYGLWSTMYGFTALNFSKGATIKGLTFYRQGETPGLGARITEPAWQAQWDGVNPNYSEDGQPNIQVVKNKDKNKNWQVDGISGATLTSRGVEHLMNFWLGKQGYEPFIRQIQSGKITAKSVQASVNKHS